MTDLSYEIPCWSEESGDCPMKVNLVNRTQYFRDEVHKDTTIYIMDSVDIVDIIDTETETKKLNITQLQDLNLVAFVKYDPNGGRFGNSNQWARSHPEKKYPVIKLRVDDPSFVIYEDEINLEMGSPDWFYVNQSLIETTDQFYQNNKLVNIKS